MLELPVIFSNFVTNQTRKMEYLSDIEIAQKTELSPIREIAAKLGITAALRVDASGTMEMTDSMRARLVPGSGGGGATRAEGS